MIGAGRQHGGGFLFPRNPRSRVSSTCRAQSSPAQPPKWPKIPPKVLDLLWGKEHTGESNQERKTGQKNVDRELKCRPVSRRLAWRAQSLGLVPITGDIGLLSQRLRGIGKRIRILVILDYIARA